MAAEVSNAELLDRNVVDLSATASEQEGRFDLLDVWSQPAVPARGHAAVIKARPLGGEMR